MSAPAVEARDLRVSYGSVLALDGASLRVERGDVHGLVGMNGSGKSTLFKALLGLVRPQAGAVTLLGTPTAEVRRRGRAAYVPQGEGVDWAFPVSVAEVVLQGRYPQMGLLRRARAADRAAVAAALERVELDGLADRQIGELSGGQRKRAFVARALAQEAELLLLDEPFAGVDKRSEELISALLRDLAAGGRAVLVSTHDLVAVPELCDVVSLVNRRVLATGRPEEVLVADRLAEAFGGFVPREALRATPAPTPTVLTEA